jgi:hypothetical protein
LNLIRNGGQVWAKLSRVVCCSFIGQLIEDLNRIDIRNVVILIKKLRRWIKFNSIITQISTHHHEKPLKFPESGDQPKLLFLRGQQPEKELFVKIKPGFVEEGVKG